MAAVWGPGPPEGCEAPPLPSRGSSSGSGVPTAEGGGVPPCGVTAMPGFVGRIEAAGGAAGGEGLLQRVAVFWAAAGVTPLDPRLCAGRVWGRRSRGTARAEVPCTPALL